MGGIIEQLDAWVTALALAAVLVGAWRVGRWRGRLSASRGDQPAGKFTDASLAILGLLLAFTFSLSLGKHEQRRSMAVADSNAIGDFYTCATLLKEPTHSKLQGVIHDYVEHRLGLTRQPLSTADQELAIRRIQAFQGKMTDLVGEALTAGTPIAVPLTNTLNEVTSSHAARLAAQRDRLPWVIVLLLCLAAVVSLLLLGQDQGAADKQHFVGTASFIVLVTLVFYVTLDLNQPNRGLITVSQEPFERLLQSMGK